MKAKIVRLDFSHLRNSEYPQVFNHVVRIIEKHQPLNLQLGNAFVRLKAHLPIIDKITARDSGSALSNKLQAKDEQRDSLFRVIAAQVKVWELLDSPQKSGAVELINRFLKKHGHNIPDDNYTAETERLKDLLEEYKANDELIEAANDLNIAAFFDQLEILNNEFVALFSERTAQNSLKEIVDSKMIRSKANLEMNTFINIVELFSIEYSDLNYTPLIQELNTLFDYYKTALKARATRRRNGENVDEEEQIPTPGVN